MTDIIKDPLTKDECICWIAKLRSGDIEQGRGALRNADGSMCCLGVLNEVCGLDRPGHNGVLYEDDTSTEREEEEINIYLKLSGLQQNTLWTMNDTHRRSFTQIANYIEQIILPTLEN